MKFGKFTNNINQLIWKFEKFNNRQNWSILFNQTCLKEFLPLKYAIYIKIYIKKIQLEIFPDYCNKNR